MVPIDLQGFLQPLFDSSTQYATTLVPYGKAFLALAGILTITNSTLQFMAGGDLQQAMGKTVRFFIIASIPFAALNSWGAWGPLDGKLVTLFTSEIAGKLVGSGGSGDVFTMIHTTVTHLFASFPLATPKSTDTSTYSQLTHLSDSIGAAITRFITAVVLFVPVVILGLALVFCLYGPLLMLQIGVIFGPLLVPWLAFEPLSNLAMKWLNYMLTMGMAFAIGILFAAISATTIHTFSLMMSSMQFSDFFAYIGGLATSITVILFLAFMMFKIEHIAAGLVGGPAIGGGGAFLLAAAAMARKAGSGGKGGDKDGKKEDGKKGDKDKKDGAPSPAKASQDAGRANPM